MALLKEMMICFALCFCLVGFSTAAKCVPEECGSMKVSYPFWVNKPECGLHDFQIYCNMDEHTGVKAPFLPVDVGNIDTVITSDFEKEDYYKIWDIDYSGHIVVNSTSLKASSCRGSEVVDHFKRFQLPRPFYFSMSDKFVVAGCNVAGNYTYGNTGGQARCVSSCHHQKSPAYCNNGCCEITVPDNYWWIKFSTGAGNDPINVGYCGFSTVMDPSTFTLVDNKTDISWKDVVNAYYGLRLNWGIGLQNCSMANNTVNYSCSVNAQCIDSPSRRGHVCKCLPGYEGNGYSNGTGCTDINECINRNNNTCVGVEEGGICHNLEGGYNCSCAKDYEGDGYFNGKGCTDIDECRQANRSKCVGEEEGGICHNLAGSYNCSCAKGYKGDGFINGTRCEPESSNKTALSTAIGSVSAFVVVSLGACGLVWWLRMHYRKRARKENYRCNGGYYLEKLLPKPTEGNEFKKFSEDELKKASQNYSDNMKLGSGSSGTVYKGVLSNGTLVAIKKLKEFRDGVESEEFMSPFINEIVILWSVKHPNIVRLLGCCLETPSPLLVYEFVDGGTIFQQLHPDGWPDRLQSVGLSWQSRLQIAIGSADALAYLHSGLKHPIIHRDVKSSNILLGENETPKVADFGMSRLLCGNDEYLTNTVVSNRGYMDPDYLGTDVLNDKSDVYSFGVFLAELLTGKKPFSESSQYEERVLYKLFLSKCDKCLTDILDPIVKKEKNQDQVSAVARIAKECLCPEGIKRPSMKEVKTKLSSIEPATPVPCSSVHNESTFTALEVSGV